MELNQIRYFLALARTLNFTRAAELCNVTQPALTKAIQRLESELGGYLIHRERHLTQLTDLGKLVLPMLERAFAASETARLSADDYQRKQIAPLKVALGSCMSPAIIQAPFAEIGRFVPGLQIDLIEAEPRELPELLLRGEINAAFTGEEVGTLPLRIDHWTLFTERVMVLVPIASKYGVLEELTLEDLAGASWLECTASDAAESRWRKALQSADGMRVAHRARNQMHLQYMVSAGLGVMLWPEHAPHIPSVVAKPVASDAFVRDILLLVVAGRLYSPALEALAKTSRVHDWKGMFARAKHSRPTPDVAYKMEPQSDLSSGASVSPPVG